MAAILLGASDTCAALASRDAKPIVVTRTAVFVSGIVVLVGLSLISSQINRHDALLSLASGLSMTTGLIFLYHGYANAAVGVVAPTSSVLTAAVPLLVELLRGSHLGWKVGLGAMLGIAGIGLATYEPSSSSSEPNSAQRKRLGVQTGVLSGICFGAGFSTLAHTSGKAGILPVLIQRGGGFVFLLALWAVVGGRNKAHGVASNGGLNGQRSGGLSGGRGGSGSAMFGGPLLVTKGREGRLAVLAGVFAAVAICCLKIGFRRGPIGPVAIAGSQFATFSVIFAVIFRKEPLRRLAAVGITLAAIAVALMSTS